MRQVVVSLANDNPGIKLMIHDEVGGTTSIVCTDCWHNWTVLHDDVVEMDETDPPVSRCPQCGDPVRPLNMSTEVGHA